MPYDRPYFVEDDHQTTGFGGTKTVYALCSSADGRLVTGTDLLFMHKLADVLNEEHHSKDVHR